MTTTTVAPSREFATDMLEELRRLAAADDTKSAFGESVLGIDPSGPRW
jgi:hypothetical protein